MRIIFSFSRLSEYSSSYNESRLWVKYILKRDGDVNLKNDSKTVKHITVKPVLSGHPKRIPKFVFKTFYRLMQVKSIVECLMGAFCNTFDLH